MGKTDEPILPFGFTNRPRQFPKSRSVAPQISADDIDRHIRHLWIILKDIPCVYSAADPPARRLWVLILPSHIPLDTPADYIAKPSLSLSVLLDKGESSMSPVPGISSRCFSHCAGRDVEPAALSVL